MNQESDQPVAMSQEAQQLLEEACIKPMAETLVDSQPPSPLESRKQKCERVTVQLRTSFSTYRNCFIHAGQLLANEDFTLDNSDLSPLELLIKRPQEAMEKMIEEDLSPQELVNLSDEEVQRIYAITCGYYERTEYENARDLFLLLMTLCPSVATFCAGLGMAEQQLGHYDMATIAYTLATELNPDDPSVYLYAANCLHLQNRTEEATQVLNLLIESIGDDEEFQELKEQATELKQSWEQAA